MFEQPLPPAKTQTGATGCSSGTIKHSITKAVDHYTVYNSYIYVTPLLHVIAGVSNNIKRTCRDTSVFLKEGHVKYLPTGRIFGAADEKRSSM